MLDLFWLLINEVTVKTSIIFVSCLIFSFVSPHLVLYFVCPTFMNLISLGFRICRQVRDIRHAEFTSLLLDSTQPINNHVKLFIDAAPGLVRRQERTRDPFLDTVDSNYAELETLPDTDSFPKSFTDFFFSLRCSFGISIIGEWNLLKAVRCASGPW